MVNRIVSRLRVGECSFRGHFILDRLFEKNPFLVTNAASLILNNLEFSEPI